MANNILDKPAMESIHEIEKTIAVMAATVDSIPVMCKDIEALAREVVGVKGELISLGRRIDEEPIKCPFRESATLLQEVVKDVVADRSELKQAQRDISSNAKAIAEVKTEVRITGGVNATLAAAFASIAGVLSNILGK